jgi:hypothetical protein
MKLQGFANIAQHIKPVQGKRKEKVSKRNGYVIFIHIFLVHFLISLIPQKVPNGRSILPFLPGAEL